MNSDSKFFLGILIGAIVIIGAIIFFSTHNSSEYSNVNTTDGQKLGPDNAKVQIVEFSDFQCPACAAAYPYLEQAQKNNSNEVQVIFRHFPLTQIHDNTIAASMAAEAAGVQGKFWEMAKKLFENQASWGDLSSPNSTFVSYARDLGLDATQFEKDLDNPDLNSRVEKDSSYATELGINSTPTFYINGTKIVGARTVDQWQELIDSAKAKTQ